ncbi:MAG TPA: uridine kinase [Clostridia bacterium]|nr:uridine kinase [Clostridia bacterium]
MVDKVRVKEGENCRNTIQVRYPGLMDRIDSLMGSGKPINIAIDGNSGAGKSTLAEELGGIYDANIFHMDDFFLTPTLRTEERLREVGGNVDYLRFREEIIEGLKTGQGFKYRPYNCQTMALEGDVAVVPRQLNIIEGVYSMHPTLTESYDLKIFLSVDSEEQSRRILERNGAMMHKRFTDEWIPMEDEYFHKMGIRQECDLIFEV